MNVGGLWLSINGIIFDLLYKLSDVWMIVLMVKGGCMLLDFVVEFVDVREDGEISLTNEFGVC